MSLPRVKLLERVEVAESTCMFRVEKPEGFSYRAGQFADYTLADPDREADGGVVHGFSLSSAPYESTLASATRLRDSAFKRLLRSVPIGTELELDAPYGSFTLHNNTARPAVFLTGGIGVTPVRSMVLQSTHDHSGHDLVVFVANHRPEDAVFLDDFAAAARDNDHLRFVPTMTGMERSSRAWDGETGHINLDMLSRHVEDLSAPIYYLCGPASMVLAMRGVLNGAGIDDDDIRTEEFAGY